MNSQKRQRVVCGMSGGVDSSATAALLIEQGFEVIGITLKLWPQDCVNRAEDKCCGPQAVTDARAVCDKLGVPYYLIDEAAEFQKHVIQYFADEYKAGRTPNPCVMCNQNLKFGRLIERADQLGARYIATGHFARIERREDGRVLGQHDGIEFYTIGQRKGLGISSPKPLYVVDLDAASNRVTVGDESALERDEFTVDRCNWIPFDRPPGQLEAAVKIRYNHPG